MKINLLGLRELYQSSISEPDQMNRGNCPSPEILSACIQGRASKKNKDRVIEHLTLCRFCLEEFQFILEINKEQKTFIQKISYHLNSDSKKNSPKRKRSYFPISLNYKKLSYLTAATLFVAAVALAFFLFFDGGLEQEFRGTNHEFLKLIQPTHNRSAKIPIVFHWRQRENVEYYILELFDDALFPIWKSQKILENKILLPKDITEALSPNKRYYWFITGFLPGDVKIESSLEQFQIKR